MPGDYADQFVDRMLGVYWWSDPEDWDEEGWARRLARRDLECQKCKAKGLRWLHVNNRQKMGWTISEDGVLPHECPMGDLSSFEVVSG